MNTDLKNQTQLAKLINLKANEARRAQQQMQTSPRTLMAPTVLRRVAAHG